MRAAGLFVFLQKIRVPEAIRMVDGGRLRRLGRPFGMRVIIICNNYNSEIITDIKIGHLIADTRRPYSS